MVRFSIDSVFDVSDDDNDDDVELETNHRDNKPTNDDSDDEEEEEEDAHPLGFGTSWSKHATNISSSWGRTRFCLDPPRETLREYQKRWGYDDILPSSSSTKLLSPQQTFPSLSNYLDPDTAPTAALARLALHHQEQDQKEQELALYGHMSPQHPTTPLRLTMSSSSSSSSTTKRPLSSSSHALAVVPAKSPSTPSLPPTPPLSSAYLQVADDMKKLAQVSQVRYQKIQQHMQHERHKMQQEHDQFQKALQALLRDDEAEANRVRRQYQEEQQMRLRQQQQQQEEDEERARQEEEEAATAAAKIEEQAKQKQEQQQQQQQALKEATDAKAAAQQQENQQQQSTASSTPPRRTPTADTASDDTPEYVAAAQRLVSKLVLVRESVAPFETSKLVSQRRLRMKKIVNGKVNTLSESVDKIRQVAHEVSDAIHQARQEDDQMKLQMQQAKAQQGQQQQVPPELGRGKRYLVDLLASSTIVRAQAEGFNG